MQAANRRQRTWELCSLTGSVTDRFTRFMEGSRPDRLLGGQKSTCRLTGLKFPNS